jgi:hypothetical protein
MYTENLAVNDGGNWEEIEQVRALLPDVNAAEFADAFVIEAVCLRHLARFVVPPEKCHPRGKADKEGEEIEEGFDGMIAAIHVIAEEKITGVRALTTNSEKLLKIKELAVDVAADCHRRAE